MCRYPGPINLEYARDLTRGRLSDTRRFDAIKEYAVKRWGKTKNMKYALQWHKVIEAVDRRNWR